MDKFGQFLLLPVHGLPRHARAAGVPAAGNCQRRESGCSRTAQGPARTRGPGEGAWPRSRLHCRQRAHARRFLHAAEHVCFRSDRGRQGDLSKISFVLRVARAKDILDRSRSEEHTSELQSHLNLVCRLLLEKKKKNKELYKLYICT